MDLRSETRKWQGLQVFHFDSEDCPNPRPPENHLSLASLTRWASTALFVNWNPWTGVTVSEVAVPEVCWDCCAATVNRAVLSLFALDSFATRGEE
jgi:hypothetical protein